MKLIKRFFLKKKIIYVVVFIYNKKKKFEKALKLLNPLIYLKQTNSTLFALFLHIFFFETNSHSFRRKIS